MKNYIILNTSDSDESQYYGCIIPEKLRPTFVHFDKEKALDEITRLKKRHPECSFELFESIAEYREHDVCLREIKGDE